jgi:hypothetical protein
MNEKRLLHCLSWFNRSQPAAPHGCSPVDARPQPGSHTSVVQLRAAITEYLDAHNEAPKPFKWTKNADEILESIARFASRTSKTHREP